jgi:hypothetical protein
MSDMTMAANTDTADLLDEAGDVSVPELVIEELDPWWGAPLSEQGEAGFCFEEKAAAFCFQDRAVGYCFGDQAQAVGYCFSTPEAGGTA